MTFKFLLLLNISYIFSYCYTLVLLNYVHKEEEKLVKGKLGISGENGEGRKKAH